MEEKDPQKRPLRSTSNKVKDLYDTYIKNSGGRQIPITDDENEKEMDDMKQENENNKEVLEEQADRSQNENSNDAQEAFDELNKQINKLEEEKKDLQDQILRKAAEFENFRRRSIKEKQEMSEYGSAKLLENMLGILDDMDNAVQAAEKAGEKGALYEGLVMVRGKARKHFADEGVKEMDDPIGTEFNVDKHEAVMRMPDDSEEGTVVQVVQKGYLIKEKVLRHAKVVTSAGPQE